uniref:Uncharacterized protein n=1 Tax=Scleropages formosus TaxID=113540 RepID=A0A8C9RMP4_SCLFO
VQGRSTLVEYVLVENVQRIVQNEKLVKQKVDLQSLPTQAMWTVVPVLRQGLYVLAKERPSNPTEFLAAYFLKNK